LSTLGTTKAASHRVNGNNIVCTGNHMAFLLQSEMSLLIEASNEKDTSREA
jgi:hypothetical protein